MFLITSAAYITSDLHTEFGKIPPSFLPLQNKRLFRHQLELAFSVDDEVILSLPEGFTPSEEDLLYIQEQNVTIVYVPEKFSLGESVAHVLKLIGKFQNPLRILHGDTLFFRLLSDYDMYIVGKASDNYSWAISADINGEDMVYAGFFSFARQDIFLESLTKASYDFVEATLKYKKKVKIKEILVDSWFDFGHSNTYYRSKSCLTTQRTFNNLEIDAFTATKFSKDKKKILGEANWFTKLPLPFKRYTPGIWDFGIKGNYAFYQIEYFYLSTLAELFVFGKNQYFVWENILHACNQFMKECYRNKAPFDISFSKNSNKSHTEKTMKRLSDFAIKNQVDLDREWIFNGTKMPSLNQLVKETDELITCPPDSFHTIIHGDFCFSNILYNFKTQSIKVIDPRGIDFQENQTIYGDFRYDIAKLAHSVIGLYDFIITGYFNYSEKSEYDIQFSFNTSDVIQKVQNLFRNSRFGGLSLEEACTYPILIQLFLSMLPLHCDNPLRQKAMLANSFRLYTELKTTKSVNV